MNHKILAIDDSAAIRTFITKALGASEGEFEIFTAVDGEDGVKKANETKPDLILLDYILPDTKGDQVCQRLLNSPVTATIPIVMMSSNVGDIQRTTVAFENVVRSIAKPFTAELLGTTIRGLIRDKHGVSHVPAPVAAPSTNNLIFAGNTTAFPIHRVLAAVEEEELTGLLRVESQRLKLQVYTHSGRIALVTTQDVEKSFELHPFQFHVTGEQEKNLELAKAAQKEFGKPVFVSLSEKGMVNPQRAVRLCGEYGVRLLSDIWTAGKSRYSFETLANFPDFVPIPQESGARTVDEWIIASLRHVGDECLSAMAWGDLTGIPIYTRDGYERIARIPVLEAEAKFLREVGENSLVTIAERSGMPPELAQRVLFRFLCLGIFEYWPAALFRGEAQEVQK